MVNWMLAAQMVPSQLNTFTARGQGDHDGGDHEARAQARVHAALEHVMAPDDEAQPGDAGDGVNHRLVAEQRLAGEGAR